MGTEVLECEARSRVRGNVVLATKLQEAVDSSVIGSPGRWSYTELNKLLQGCRKDIVGHARMMTAVGRASGARVWNR